jgi:hypothetical protein
MNNALMNICVHKSMWAYICISLGLALGAAFLGNKVNLCLTFFKNYKSVFQNSCTTTHSHQWYRKVQVSPHPH